MKIQVKGALCVLIMYVSVSNCALSLGLQNQNTASFITSMTSNVASVAAQKYGMQVTTPIILNSTQVMQILKQLYFAGCNPKPQYRQDIAKSISTTTSTSALTLVSSPLISSAIIPTVTKSKIDTYVTPLPPKPSPIIPTPTPIIGGFSRIENPSNDKGVSDVASYLQKFLGNKQVKSITVLEVWSQLVNGMNYKLIFQFEYLSTVTLKYEIIIYVQRDGTKSVSSAKLIDIAPLDTATFRKFVNPKQSGVVHDIDAQLKDQYSNMTEFTDLIDAYVAEPYFTFTYGNKQKLSTNITFVYDPIANRTQIISVEQEKIQEVPNPIIRPLGAYNKIENPQTHQGAVKAISYLQTILSKRPIKSIKVLEVWDQCVMGMNYMIKFEFSYLQKLSLKYEIVINISFDGKKSVVTSKLLDIPPFSSSNFRKYANPKQAAQVQDIDALLKVQYANNMTELTDLIEVSVSEPYFIFAYANKQKGTTRISFVYDPIANDTDILNVSQETPSPNTNVRPL